jgi:hypothetical protein
MHRTTVVPERYKYWHLSYLSWREYGAKTYTRVFTYPVILHTGKKVRLQIHIDHKMFDMFTSRNVKTNLNIHSHVRPNTRSAPTMSDQILGVKGCWLSNLSDISLEWVGHFGRDMSDLRVCALIHLECTVPHIWQDISMMINS